MRISHIGLTVNNLEESMNFYSKFFGFKLVNKFSKPNNSAVFCYMELNGFQIELFEFKDMKPNKDDLEDLTVRGLKHFAFEVEDVHQKVKELREIGLNFPEPQLGSSGKYFTLGKDINGIQLEIINAKSSRLNA